MSTLRAMLKEGTDRLREAGVPDPRFDARVLLEHALGMDTAHILLYEDQELADVADASNATNTANAANVANTTQAANAAEKYQELLKLRAQRVPLQQLLGSVWFYGFEFLVNRHVLCPREDTETLVGLALEKLQERQRTAGYGQEDQEGQAPVLLDLCTGSGCIAISIAGTYPLQRVLAADVSSEALEVAWKNAERLLSEEYRVVREGKTSLGENGLPASGRQLSLLESDLFSAIPEWLRQQQLSGFDLVVSNPPYIPSSVVDTLEPEVREYEPRLALDGRQDGLYFYRRIAEEVLPFLLPGGWLLLEIGYDQGQAVSELLTASGFSSVAVEKDPAGNDRVVLGQKTEEKPE